MLQMRPSCEHCDKALPPNSREAMVCSYECTFCADCVEHVLGQVCPNCGGNFVPRPIRPSHEWRPGVSLRHQPAREDKVFKPVDEQDQKEFAARVRKTAPEAR
ncbi:DUF1272 domain-containing protein [Kordiimonas sp.]|uniref:DUF1272 domain-containing protein n=1 Tax=Kordiimonas sp. TaxID=1970157 RepID=UPI003A94DFA7